MKFSYNWIRELVAGLDCAPGALERLITMKTAECEGIEPSGELLRHACIARVESVAPIAGSHNVAAVVDAGPACEPVGNVKRTGFALVSSQRAAVL